MQYNQIPSDDVIEKAIEALRTNGFKVDLVSSKQLAKKAALDIIPKGAEVFAVTSKTLEYTGIKEAIDESGQYISVRKKLLELANQPDKEKERKQIGSTPDYVIGSAHAITEDGKIMVASGTGSQLAAEAYGANHVIYIIGAQKIVKDIQDGINRIEEHTIPLENQRLQEVYNDKNAKTIFSRLFIYNKDLQRDVHIIIVKENVGF